MQNRGPNQVVISAYALAFIRVAIGFVYFYFGFLKFFPDLSPAELIASQTITRLSLSWIDARTALLALAVLECVVGGALVFGIGLRLVFFLFFFHMAGTIAPLILLPELTFKVFPFAPTLEGQYIVKNIVFIAAGCAIVFASIQPREPISVHPVAATREENAK